jgi:hypothetical protein
MLKKRNGFRLHRVYDKWRTIVDELVQVGSEFNLPNLQLRERAGGRSNMSLTPGGPTGSSVRRSFWHWPNRAKTGSWGIIRG